MPSKKRLVKQTLREEYPDAFYNEYEKNIHPNYVFSDHLGVINSLGALQDIDVLPGSVILNAILKKVSECLERPDCMVYIMVFDKPDFVCPIKGMERERRALKSNDVPCPDPTDNQVLFDMNAPSPYSWKSMLVNRKARRLLLSQIVHAIQNCYWPPAGKILVIDGGTLGISEYPMLIESLDTAGLTKLRVVKHSYTYRMCELGKSIHLSRGSIATKLHQLDSEFIPKIHRHTNLLYQE